jgi:beta-glucosidase
MPYYGIPVDQTSENVGFGFNKEIITGILRNKMKYNGVVCADYYTISPDECNGEIMGYAKCWCVEELTVEERFLKAIEAGIDQFGGEKNPALVIKLVEQGRVSEHRIDSSARRILKDKFRLGLFDQPYVDETKAVKICGKEKFQAAADSAQRNSIVLLKNRDDILPLNSRAKIYILNINPAMAGQYATVVGNIDQCDFVLMRIDAPYEERSGPLEFLMHQGSLEFNGQAANKLIKILKAKPAVVCVNLDRPAIIPGIAENAFSLLAAFGASDAAVLDIVFGKFNPSGKLPFDLPSSMESVYRQKEDVPFDSKNPLFRYGDGLSYKVQE